MQIAAKWRLDDDLRIAALRIWAIGLCMGAGALALIATIYYTSNDGVGMDAHAYWLAGRRQHPYGPGPGERDAFLYSPLFAQAMRPLALLPWHVFCGVVIAMCGLVYYWLLSPLPTRWRIPALLFCVPELLIGNIYALLAASLVIALSRPEALAFPTLTKITPALPCGVWFIVRGEWRHALRAVAATTALTAVSFAYEPGMWVEWLKFLSAHSGSQGVEYPLRVVAALALAVHAGRRNRAWLLAVAFWLSMPLAGLGPQSLIPLVAIVRLVQVDRHPVGMSTRSNGRGVGSFPEPAVSPTSSQAP
jgi:hypothetical protein